MNSYLQMLYVMTIWTVILCSTGAEWRVVWRDDFNDSDKTLPSQNNWIIDKGTSYPGGSNNWGTGEVETYTSNIENLSLDGRGHLKITPQRSQSGQWTSGRIETRKTDFRPPQGGMLAIEGRIRLPDIIGNKAVGYWSAFWTLGAPFRGNYQNWPTIGEFNIMESVNGLNFVKAVLHCGTLNGGPCNENGGLGVERQCPGGRCEFDFHKFRFEWDDKNKEFRWYVNGEQYYRVTRNQIGTKTWNQITNHGYFIILNVAMGGGYPNHKHNGTTPTSDTEPGHSMLVDYVAVYTYT